MEKLYRILISFVFITLIACNNNEEFVQDIDIMILQEYPIIENYDYKDNPILSGLDFPSRYAVIKSKEDLSILPDSYVTSQELNDINFDNDYVIACRIDTDESIYSYDIIAKINPTTNILRITIDIKASEESNKDTITEYIIIFRIKQVKYNAIQYSIIQS